MPNLSDVTRDDPQLAADIRAAFAHAKHATIATLRSDGAPRISGTEVEITDAGEIFIGSPADARKSVDLRRDPRLAIHSPTRDPQPDGWWPGEAKMSGVAVEVPAPDEWPSGAKRFRIDLTSAVFTGLDPDDHTRLRIRLWRPGRPSETMYRT